jgi:hypothetical protein
MKLRATSLGFVLLAVAAHAGGCAEGPDPTFGDEDAAAFPEGLGLAYRSPLANLGDTLRISHDAIVVGRDARASSGAPPIEIFPNPFSPPLYPYVYVLVPDSLTVRLARTTGEAVYAVRGFYAAGQYQLYIDPSGTSVGGYYVIEVATAHERQLKLWRSVE